MTEERLSKERARDLSLHESARMPRMNLPIARIPFAATFDEVHSLCLSYSLAHSPVRHFSRTNIHPHTQTSGASGREDVSIFNEQT